MGRNPWLSYSRQLVKERADWSRTKEGTAQERERKLRYLGGIVKNLYETGDLTTKNPAKLGERDILILFRFLKEDLQLRPATMHKYLGIVGQICAVAGNAIVASMKSHPVKSRALPRGSGKAAKRSFRLESVLAFLETAKERAEKTGTWWDIAAYGAASFTAGFGVRPKELRHLSLRTWRSIAGG